MKIIVALVVFNAFASVLAAVPQQSRDPFLVSLRCSRQYCLGEKVVCKFFITNTHNVDYSVLKIGNPLEGMRCPYLSVSRDGIALPYDGMFAKRNTSSPLLYKVVEAGSTVSAEINLCNGYAINIRGDYSVQLKTKLVYHTGPPGTPPEHIYEQTVHIMATFRIYGVGTPRMTQGEFYRQLSEDSRQKRANGGNPLDPKFTRGTAQQRASTKRVHRASHLYISTAGTDIDQNRSHYVRWFGKVGGGRLNKVKRNFSDMKSKLETTTYTYVFKDPNCEPGDYAFVFIGGTMIFLCDLYDDQVEISGVNTKLCTVVHELTHLVSNTDDIDYGTTSSLNLAKNRPNDAIRNADNYCYFTESINVSDYE